MERQQHSNSWKFYRNSQPEVNRYTSTSLECFGMRITTPGQAEEDAWETFSLKLERLCRQVQLRTKQTHSLVMLYQNLLKTTQAWG